MSFQNCRSFLYLILFLLFSSSAQCQDSGVHFYLLKDSTKLLKAEEVLASVQHGLVPEVHSLEKNAGFTRSIFWVVMTRNTSKKDSSLLYIGDPHINRIYFYSADSGKVTRQFITGDYFPFHQRPFPATGYYFPVTGSGTWLARIDKSNESLQLSYHLTNTLTALQTESSDALIIFMMTGMVLVMIIFGIYLFIISRDLLYIQYIFYIASGWLWVLANGGYGFHYLWPDSPWFASKARPVFSISTVALSMVFMMNYTGLQNNRLLQRSLFTASSLLWLCVGIILLFNERGYQSVWWLYMQFAVPLVVLLYILFSLSFLIYNAWKGNRLALFYLIAFGGLILFTVAQLAFYTGKLGHKGFLSQYGMPLGYVLESLIITAGLVFRFNQYRRDREKLLEEMNRRQEENTRVMMEVQEAERNQIANQLHDVAGSLLSAAKLNLSSLRENKIMDIDTGNRLAKAEEAVSQVSDTVRNLSHALSPVMMNKVGFRTSMEKLVSLFNAAGKFHISLVVLGFEENSPAHYNYYTSLYGIIYELLNNIVRHSECTNALIQVMEHSECFTIIAEDNGRGIKDEDIHGKQTHGLTGITSKIDYFKGRISFEKNEPCGSIITIEIPRVNYGV